jgi:colanic acid biosynthesis glycosyl transferase WcaI
MKILFITDNFPPETNASASRVYERAKYWQAAGHEVTFLTSVPNFPQGIVHEGYKNKWYQTEIMGGMEVKRVKTFMAENKGFILRVLDFLSFMFMAIFVGSFLKKPDVIVATSPQFFAGYAGLILSKIKRRPFVLELGDLWPESLQGVGVKPNSFMYRFIEKLELLMYKYSTYIIVQTNAFKKNLVHRKVPEAKISVVLNGVDTSFFKPQLQKDEQLLKELNLENKKIVSYMGTFGMAHGLTHAMDIAKILENTNIVFLLLGDGACKKDLLEYKKENDIKNVLILDSQKKENMPKFWSICDISLVHLKNEKCFASVIPSKIFESTSVGKPIMLVAPKGEASDLVLTHQLGIHCSSYEPIKDAHLLRALLESEERIVEIARKMHHKAPSFDRKLQSDLFIKSLEKVVKQ